MIGRRTLLFGTTLALTVVPPVVGTASASARVARSTSVSNRSLALHRAENRWHLRQMRGHRPVFARINRSVHRRFPFAAPVADRAVGVTHVIHQGMGWGDDAFLRFHEGWAAR